MSGRRENVQIHAVSDAGAGLVQVSFRVTPAFAASYATVGQYVQVTAEGSQAYFALSCSPGEDEWTLLVRPRGVVAEALAGAHVGQEFTVSEPLGSGFDWQRTLDADVFVVVAGTGFAIAPPILRARIDEGVGSRTTLLLGTDGHVPLESALAQMEHGGGISIVLCAPVLAIDVPRATMPFSLLASDLESALTARLDPFRLESAKRQRRRVCVIAAGPEPLLAALQNLVRVESDRTGAPWCELLLNA